MGANTPKWHEFVRYYIYIVSVGRQEQTPNKTTTSVKVKTWQANGQPFGNFIFTKEFKLGFNVILTELHIKKNLYF